MKNLQVYSINKDFPDKQTVHKLTSELSKNLNFSIESLDINFINAEKITNINSEYLDHHNSTDIITFNYSGSNSKLDGEMFISLDDAEKNAKKYNVTSDEEILRLVIHGILHLLGYDDLDENERKVMKEQENALLNSFKIPLLNKNGT